MFGRLTWLDKRIGTGELNANLPLWVCKTVGGTSVHWAGAALRFQEHEFKARTTYGEIQGANLLDWPLSYDEIAPFYDKAEYDLGVSGKAGNVARVLKTIGHDPLVTGFLGGAQAATYREDLDRTGIAHDFVTVEHAALMQHLIPGARLAVLPNTTHMQATDPSPVGGSDYTSTVRPA